MSKIGRNEPCPCGSGKKYKKCCDQKQSHKKGSNNSSGILNKRFNRYELTNTHIYGNELGYEARQTDDYFKKQYSGYIKCKLVHQNSCSNIIPDQIYIESEPLLWIQPLAFFGNVLGKMSEDEIYCGLHIDISCGHMIKVIFDNNNDYITKFSDGSNLFKCKIEGPINLEDYAIGIAYFADDMTPYLKLYHHTNEDAKKSILESEYFKPSSWNIQGTKQLENVGYAYFTCLDCIKNSDDLRQIAMAPDDTIKLMVDNFNQPAVLFPGWEETYKNEILCLTVSRKSIEDTKATIEMDIDASLLSPQHLFRHEQLGSHVFYAICNPFIYRIGIEPDAVLSFTNNAIRKNNEKLKMFKYVVVGDARTIYGLEAPYDEENTKAIAKIEDVNEKGNILDFWFDHGNTDLFSGKNIEFQNFL